MYLFIYFLRKSTEYKVLRCSISIAFWRGRGRPHLMVYNFTCFQLCFKHSIIDAPVFFHLFTKSLNLLKSFTN